ncbi:MAG TPA: hypothetical protein VMT22_08640 [Terriglobales bacterium]|jgi:Tfp pilus assembly protein FimT|nr:hypothetical protein [Terriglobales bacterium]
MITLARRIRQCDGFTFNELLVSMNLIAVAVLGYSISSISVTRQQVVSSNSTVAIHLAQDKLEELQARVLLTDIDLCPDAGDHAISAKHGMAGIFDRCWKVFPSSLDANLKQIEVTVSWHDYEPHQVTLTALTYISDP